MKTKSGTKTAPNNPINQQTPGPLFEAPPAEELLNEHDINLGTAEWIMVAQVSGDVDTGAQTKADARLLAAAYNAFDKAGREIGVDAATLAEKIDLTRIIREWASNEQWSANTDETVRLNLHL